MKIETLASRHQKIGTTSLSVLASVDNLSIVETSVVAFRESRGILVANLVRCCGSNKPFHFARPLAIGLG